jgi:hypothetical protein
MSLLPKILPRDPQQKTAALERELLQIEAEIGGQLFGSVPKGHVRQFFCLDRHTWVWHEEWLEGRQRRVVTTRYDVRPNGILKLQDGKPYQRLSDDEAVNLYRAVELYGKRVGAKYQQMLQAA